MDPSITLASATTALADTHPNVDAFLDPAIAQEEIHATTAEIINASIRTAARAHAEAEASAAAAIAAQAASPNGTPGAADALDLERNHDIVEDLDPILISNGETAATGAGSSSATPAPITRALLPYPRPERDETTDYPLELDYASREEFETWLSGESSWCHYVQRRVTNPEKRSEERLRAREKAHERLLDSMTEEERAMQRPLKKRKRARTSRVVNKITYTCHHAGKYSAQHNTDLPQEKLRMNTKVSVKCGCTSRIVMNEMDDGEVKAVFYWKHTGHDPFADNEAETYRLPALVNDWLLSQFSKGRLPEEIRKLLDIPEDEKAERIRLASESQEQEDYDTMLESDTPPALAYSVQISYPDLYNRYRKVGPPLRGKKGGEEGSVEPATVTASAGNGVIGAGKRKIGNEGAKRGRKRKAEVSGTVSTLAAEVQQTQPHLQHEDSSAIPGGTGALEPHAEEVEVKAGVDLAVDGLPEITDGDGQEEGLFLDGDGDFFADLDERYPHLDSVGVDPQLAAATSGTGFGSQQATSSGLALPTGLDSVEDPSAVLMTSASGVDAARGVASAVDDSDADMALLEEDETSRMTAELEKLANEITSTWRQ